MCGGGASMVSPDKPAYIRRSTCTCNTAHVSQHASAAVSGQTRRIERHTRQQQTEKHVFNSKSA